MKGAQALELRSEGKGENKGRWSRWGIGACTMGKKISADPMRETGKVKIKNIDQVGRRCRARTALPTVLWG